MNILLLDHFNRHGGAQEYIIEIGHQLQQQGVKVFIPSSSVKTLDKLIADLPTTGFNILDKNYKNPKFLINFVRNIFQLKRFIKENNIAQIHCNSIPVLPLAKLASFDVPISFTAHDFLSSKIKNGFIKLFADKVIAVSSSVKESLEEQGVTKTPIQVIYNGFYPIENMLESPKRDKKVFAIIGRIERWKGVDIFIKAGVKLSKKYKDVEFLVFGYSEDKAYHNYCADLASQSNGSVKLMSFLEDKEELYRSVDFVVNASIEPEPFGRTIVEASLRNKPVIGPDIGGPKEIILNGKTGFIFKRGCVDSLAEKMEILLLDENLCSKMGVNGELIAKEKYSIENVTSEFCSFLKTTKPKLNLDKNNKKAVIVLDKNLFTSIGIIASQFEEALKKIGWNASIIWLSSDRYFPDGAPQEEFVVHTPSYAQGFISYRNGIKKILKQIDPSWVLIMKPELSFLIPSIKTVVPNSFVSVMIHDTFAQTLYKGILKYELVNKYYTSNVVMADGYLFNSGYTYKEAKKFWNLIGLENICGCVIDNSVFYNSSNEYSNPREVLNLPKQGRIFLNVSIDEPRKNILTFFKLALKYRDDVFVRVGKWSKWMEKFVKDNSLNNIIHKSNLSVEELRLLYSISDAYIFPSILEGFGIPPLEAMACGTKVISSKSTAMAEVLGGVCPLIENPKDVEAYSKEIDSLDSYNERYSQEAINGRLKYYSIDSFASRIKNHLDEIFEEI